jgi:hypothetical protein
MDQRPPLYTIILEERSYLVGPEDGEIVRTAIDRAYETFRVTAIGAAGADEMRVEIKTSGVRGVIKHEPRSLAEVIPLQRRILSTV